MKRILVIRGGAIGDFILTLPALKALRDGWPDAWIEVLGYKHIAALAENRFYAQAVRSIEYGSLSSFFAGKSDLPSDLWNYFGSFDAVLSYLYDPDRIFENNVLRCGVANFISGPSRLDDSTHATRQLAQPVGQLGLAVNDFAARLYLSEEDRQFARGFFRDRAQPVLAIHPGSGSAQKNWPIENWIALGSETSFLVVISGEADEPQRVRLRREWDDGRACFATNLPLTQLAAVLEHSIFVGHDSGISHLAAATGAQCLLLFGPTDPAIWAPLNEHVQILRAPDGDLRKLDVDVVRSAMR